MFKDMKIRNKTILGFAVVLILTVFISVFAILNINSIAKNVRMLFDDRYMRAEVIGSIRRRIPSTRAALSEAIVARNALERENALKDATASGERCIVLMGDWKVFLETANDTEMLEKFGSVEKDFLSFTSIREKIQKAVADSDFSGASTLFMDDFVPIVNQVESKLMDIIDQETVYAGDFVKKSEELERMTMYLLIGLLGAVVLLIVFITYWITTSITRPIAIILGATEKMSKGVLSVTLNYRSKNEFGQLSDGIMKTVRTMQAYIGNIAEMLGKMAKGDLSGSIDMDYIGDFAHIKASMVEIIDSLNDIMMQINQSSHQVLSGAGQVASASQALSQGTTEQASSIEELSATIQDIANQIAKNAENAQDAKNIADQSSATMESANGKMMDMIDAMENINETSRKISKIIKTIDDIAFQTNILALNAAVEAARAGEAGKGFAVVADEVRNLASKSAEAAKDTTALIENSILAVDRGSKIADETAKSLTAIVGAAKQSADLVSKISQASTMQAKAIAQTTQGVQQISGVVQMNSATAEESAAASEELSGQADMLNQLVSKFKLQSTQDFALESKLHLPEHPPVAVKSPKGTSKY